MLPLVLLFALLLSVLTLLPLVGVLISVKIITFIACMGYCCALAGLGKGNQPEVVKLVKSSMFFGVINTVVAVVTGFLCFGTVLALGRVGVEDNIAAHWGDAIPMVTSLAAIAFFVVNGLHN